MANSADPDQLASSEANWSGSTLFAKQGISGFSRTRVNWLAENDLNSVDWAVNLHLCFFRHQTYVAILGLGYICCKVIFYLHGEVKPQNGKASD